MTGNGANGGHSGNPGRRSFRVIRPTETHEIPHVGDRLRGAATEVRFRLPTRVPATYSRLKAVNKAARDFTALHDSGKLLKVAVTCLRNDLCYRDAFIVLNDETTPWPSCERMSGRVTLPVGLGDQIFGAIVIPHCSNGTLHDQDYCVLETFATFLAISIQNLRREDELRSRAFRAFPEK